MEQSPMMSVPVAGGRQMEPLNWYFIAAACPVAATALFFLGGILPPSLIVLLFIYCLLICPASLVIGIVESVNGDVHQHAREERSVVCGETLNAGVHVPRDRRRRAVREGMNLEMIGREHDEWAAVNRR